MLDRQAFYDVANQIPYRYRHQEFLCALVKWLSPAVVVEVGTHIGATAVWLARGLQENRSGHLYCIDPFIWPSEHDQERNWHQNIENCGVKDCVTLVKGRSNVVSWPELVGMAYIDGNHSSEACRWDYRKALELGATCIAFNDHAQYAGVRKVYNEIRADTHSGQDWDVFDVPFDCGLFVVLQRQPVPPPGDPDADPWDSSRY